MSTPHTRIASRAIALLFLASALPLAGAQVCGGGTGAILSQLPDYTNGFKSDATPNSQIVAEQMVLAAPATLQSVTVWGGFGPGSSPSNAFSLIVHQDDGTGLPGAAIHTEHGVATVLTPTGMSFPPPLVPLDEYRATLTPAAPLALPAGTIWLEIYNDAAGGDAWYWLTGTLDPTSGSAGSAITFTAPGTSWSHLNPDMAMVACATELSPGDPLCFGDGAGTPCPCLNEDGAGRGCANSTGTGAQLSASGSGSVGAGDTTLHGSNLLPGQPALFFQGDQQVNGGLGNAFGDGLRCCGQGVRRLQVVQPDAGGNVSSSVDVAAEGGVGAGETKCYQLWYRDPSGGPCGTNFNLTNGYSIVWSS